MWILNWKQPTASKIWINLFRIPINLFPESKIQTWQEHLEVILCYTSKLYSLEMIKTQSEPAEQWLDHHITEKIFQPECKTSKPLIKVVTWNTIFFFSKYSATTSTDKFIPKEVTDQGFNNFWRRWKIPLESFFCSRKLQSGSKVTGPPLFSSIHSTKMRFLTIVRLNRCPKLFVSEENPPFLPLSLCCANSCVHTRIVRINTENGELGKSLINRPGWSNNFVPDCGYTWSITLGKLITENITEK